MDGRGRFLDNIFIERLWRSLKHEDIYLKHWLMRQHFTSAYAAHNGEEPPFTCPTPLSFDWEKPWRGTLDYLFVNHHLRIKPDVPD